MSKRQLLCVLGLWIMAFLFLGFPAMVDKIFALVTGIIIFISAYTLPAPSLRHDSKLTETFTENKNE